MVTTNTERVLFISGYDPNWRNRSCHGPTYIAPDLKLTKRQEARRKAGVRPELPPDLLQRCADKYGCTVGDILTLGKGYGGFSSHINAARRLCCEELCKLGWTYSQIGYRLNRSRVGIQWILGTLKQRRDREAIKKCTTR